jgi:uncharacterized DUF497 family protein
MAIRFDPAKNERNIAERGISFELARAFDWSGYGLYIAVGRPVCNQPAESKPSRDTTL